MDIQAIPDLSRYSNALMSLGYSESDGLEKFISAAQVAGPELANYLGISLTSLSDMVNSVSSNASAIPSAAANSINTTVYSLGFAIDEVTLPVTAPSTAPSSAPPPAAVNLSAQMPAVRYQGNRGTCVAHAALAAYEHLLQAGGAAQDMSEQFLYWNCKRNDGIPGKEGTWLSMAVPLLHREGCCTEGDWPYVANPIVGNEGQGPPPGSAQLAALTFRPGGFKQLSPTYVIDLKAELAGGRCVAFSIPVFNSWYRSQWVANMGDITMPVPNEIRAGGHAMCLVGYVDMPNNEELGFGRFILRNSWGANWGINSPYGAGYGTIPYAYLAKLGTEAYSIL